MNTFQQLTHSLTSFLSTFTQRRFREIIQWSSFRSENASAFVTQHCLPGVASISSMNRRAASSVRSYMQIAAMLTQGCLRRSQLRLVAATIRPYTRSANTSRLKECRPSPSQTQAPWKPSYKFDRVTGSLAGRHEQPQNPRRILRRRAYLVARCQNSVHPNRQPPKDEAESPKLNWYNGHADSIAGFIVEIFVSMVLFSLFLLCRMYIG